MTESQPQSGDIFIERRFPRDYQLRRSEIASIASDGERSYFAPTELQSFCGHRGDKYSVLTGLKTAARFITISNDHFSVTYPADVDRRDANQVLKTLEVTRNEYLHRASLASLSANVPNLEIRLNESTGDFTSRTGQPWWAAAATKGNRIELQPVAILKRRGVLFTTLRHELAHVVIDSASNNRTPRWLEEGFAIYLAGEGKMFAHYAMRGTLSNEELEKRLERPGSQQDMRALYARAYAAVTELVRRDGEASVWKKLAAG